MRLEIANIIGKIINGWLVLLIGIIPIFFLPITSEFYEFNKVILTSLSAGILLILWLAKSTLSSSFKVRTSKLDIAIILFALVNVLAASFSVDRYVSLAGWYPRFNHSLIFILSSIVIYFVVVNNLTKKSSKFALVSIYLSSVTLSILGLASYLGIYLPFDFAKVRSWTPTASINNLSLILATSIPLGIYLSTKIYRESRGFLTYIFPLTLLPILICFTFTNILGAWIAVILSTAPLLLAQRKKIFSKKYAILGIILPIWIIVTIFTYTPTLNTSTIGRLINTSDKKDAKYINFPREVTLSQTNSYSTAVGIIRNQNRALLGSGQGTFLYAYTQLKPQTINQTDVWNLRFDQPASEIFMLLAGAGVLGLISFLFLALLLIKHFITSFKNPSEDRNPQRYISASLTCLIIGSFFFIYSSSITLLFFVLIGILGSISFSRSEISLKRSLKKNSNKNSHSKIIIPIVLLIPSIVVFVFVFQFLINTFEAETHFQKSALAAATSNGTMTLSEQIAAIKENGSESTYRRQLVLTDIALARSILQNAQATLDPDQPEQTIGQKDQQDVTALINQAIEQGKVITAYQTNTQAGSSSLNVSHWETMGLVYRSLIGVAKDAELHALRTQQQAIFLDPQNPLLYISLGRTFMALGNFDSAISNFEAAIQKKPDYAVGYVGLSEALKNRPNSAARRAAVLEQALNLIPTDNPSRPEIQKAWEEALDDAQKESKTATPPPTTVNQSSPSASPTR